MIAKILSNKGAIKGAVEYSEEKKERSLGDLLYSQGFLSEDPESINDMFKFLSKQNTRVKNVKFHAALSFPVGEIHDQATLIAIVKDYMDGMGYGKQPYCAYIHNDTDNQHVHVISSRIDAETGEKISDAFEKVRSVKVSDAIENKYKIRKVERHKGKGYNVQKEGIVNYLDKVLADIFLHYVPKDIKELNALLDDTIEVKQIKIEDKTQNRTVTKGTVLNVAMPDGDNPGKTFAINSSDIPCLGKLALMKRLASGKKLAEKYKNYVRSDVYAALRQAGGSAEYFADILQKKNITVTFNENSGGIYGWGFSYLVDGRAIKYKATELDGKLSWNEVKVVFEGSPAYARDEKVGYDDLQLANLHLTTPLIQGFVGQEVGEPEWKKKRKKKRKRTD